MKLKIYAVVMTAVLIMVACGGGTKPVDPPDPPNPPVAQRAQVNLGSAIGTQAVAIKKTTTTSFNWSLIPKAYAQTTTTINVNQSFNGFCTETPQVWNSVYPNIKVIMYGGGQKTHSTCRTSINEGETAPYDGDFNADPYLMRGMPSRAYDPVMGAGTLSNLMVWTGGVPNLTNTNSGLVQIWIIKPDNTYSQAALECAPVETVSGSYASCQSANQVAVADGDRIAVTVTVFPGDNFNGINYTFTKTTTQ